MDESSEIRKDNTTPNSLQVPDSAHGFQSYSANRYEQLFDDFKYEGPQPMNDYEYEDQHRPFHAATTPMSSAAKPYEDTVVVLHMNKQGVRLSLQANMRMFIVMLVILLAIFGKPGIGDFVGTLLKTLFGPQ
jgi:hypothetical protein